MLPVAGPAKPCASRCARARADRASRKPCTGRRVAAGRDDRRARL